jgi:activator of HSP90 ATPase
MNSVRHQTNRNLRNNSKEYLKNEINEIEMNSKNRNIMVLLKGLNEFKKG